MKSHPILFSAPMVLAILDGRKTQTRRIVKPQPVSNHRGKFNFSTFTDDEGIDAYWQNGQFWVAKCPYGHPGDQLWVREAFAYSVIDPDGLSVEDDPENYDIIYRATDNTDGGWTDGCGATIKAPWKPSIHMPRWASRITLEIVSVRVERLQDISEADALSEGITCDNVIVSSYYANWHHEVTADRHFFGGCPDEGFESACEAYAALWESINGAGSWEANPWVWCVEFKRVEQ